MAGRKSPRIVTLNIIRDGKHPDRSFDVDFWQRCTPRQRMEATWQCTVDLMLMGVFTEEQLRLRRDVVRVRYRRPRKSAS